MNSAGRTRLLLLAVLLAASQVVLVGHLAAHAQPVVEHCALCATHAQPQAAIPTTESPVPVDVVSAYVGEPPATGVFSVTPQHFQPRGPPPASS
jgi:hypothetical protein